MIDVGETYVLRAHKSRVCPPLYKNLILSVPMEHKLHT